MNVRSKGSLYEINCEEEPGPGPGRRRLEITAKHKGQVIWHKAGPSNIVLGLYDKFLRSGMRVCAQCGQPGDLLPQGLHKACLERLR